MLHANKSILTCCSMFLSSTHIYFCIIVIPCIWAFLQTFLIQAIAPISAYSKTALGPKVLAPLVLWHTKEKAEVEGGVTTTLTTCKAVRWRCPDCRTSECWEEDWKNKSYERFILVNVWWSSHEAKIISSDHYENYNEDLHQQFGSRQNDLSTLLATAAVLKALQCFEFCSASMSVMNSLGFGLILTKSM